MASKYQKLSPLEHILTRPDTYVGSLEKESSLEWVLNEDKSAMVQKQIQNVSGLNKIFDEILVNAIDQSTQDKTLENIKVTINKEKGEICVTNDGKGIPILIHEKEKMYVPEMIFGELLTSSNYDDSEDRTVGGRNGYGAKLANIFSTSFELEVHDIDTQKKFIMNWSNNMRNKSNPKVTKKKCEQGLVKITFTPDLEKFNLTELNDDIISLFERRVYDACANTNETVNVFYNGKKLGYKNFEKYIDLYIGNRKETTRVYDSNKRWSVCVCHSDEGYRCVSFVNGISTTNGGTHVDYVTRQVVNKVIEKATQKNSSTQIKPNFVKEHMFIFVKATLVNPAFNSQTKTECTSKVQSFGSKYDCSEDFTKKLLKLGILEEAMALAKHKELRELNKSDGKKRQTLKGIPKLDDANKAGSSEGHKCELMLLEGDSAKTFAVSGMSEIGRDYYGLFPLRGKMLNVRDATVQQLANNAEVNHIKQIVGLQHGKKYTSLKELRYGRITILTDADKDGSHIKGLIMNFIHHFWPELLPMGFIGGMITPIIKAWKGKTIHEFYTEEDYEEWKRTITKIELDKFKIKYYKGLGTSTAQEAKTYFKAMDNNTVDYVSSETTNADINLAFKKDQADARKEWIVNGIKSNTALKHTGVRSQVTFNEFVNKDLIWFSIADLQRSIPSAIDGLKPSQRKVIYAGRKRSNTEMKVSQFASYVANESSYHHGEQSLNGTIINLAQNYVGSNNMNLLEPIGQFGTRLMGGKDSASPRYIFSKLSKNALDLFHKDDDPILNYQNDDGVSIEPEYYVPKLPLILINGAEGIGTGYSTSVPCYNPKEVESNVKRVLQGKELKHMHPWYNGFKGTIEPTTETCDSYITTGVYKKKGEGILEITELPIGKWTQDYKEFLDDMIDGKIKSFKNNCSEVEISFTIKMDSSELRKMKPEQILKDFKLTSNISIRNMHLFDQNNNIKKYNTPLEILQEFAEVKFEFYKKRKTHLVEKFTNTMTVLQNKVEFINKITNEELVVFKKKKDVIISELKYMKFDKIDNSYDYLLKMSIYSLTEEDMNKLQKEFDKIKKEVEVVKNTSIQEMWEHDLT